MMYIMVDSNTYVSLGQCQYKRIIHIIVVKTYLKM